MKKRIFAVALAAVMTISSAATVFAADEVDLEDGLTAYYTFDETLVNEVTGGEAVLHGGAGDTWNAAATGTAQYAEGQNGKAYSFAGKNGDVNTDGLELDVKMGASYTVSFWANPNTVTSATSMVFSPVSLDEGLNIADNWFGATFPTVRLWGVPNTGDVYLDNWVTAADALCGQWTYITLTSDNEGKMVLYINGASVANGQSAAGALEGMYIYLGINFWDSTFDGLLDDVAIYEKALSADEVAALYGENGVPTGSDVTPTPPTTTPSEDPTVVPGDEPTVPATNPEEDPTTAGEEATTATPADATPTDSNPVTGDVAPVAMVVLMFVAAAGIVVVLKSKKVEE